MTTIRELGQRDIVLRSLREGIDTSNATGRMVAGVLASLAELELELGRERRTAAREARRARGQAIGRPKALDPSKAALVRRMQASGPPVSAPVAGPVDSPITRTNGRGDRVAASDIRREHVLKALAEFERLGQSAFLTEYGHSEARRFRLVHEGKFYDSKAIVGVAHGYATGQFWSKEKVSGGTGPGAAVTILDDLGFYVDDATLVAIEKVNADLSHGGRAPYQYVVVLWAFAGARDGRPRTQPFSAVRDELAELLAPFAIGKTNPDPAMPWAALTSIENRWGFGLGVPQFWELDRRNYALEDVTATESEVKRLDLVEGLSPRAYEMAQNTPGFMEHATEVIARFIGDEPAFPWLLERLGVESVSLADQTPEVADALAALDGIANPRRKFGRRFSAAENKAIEEQAVRVVRKHLKEVLGYETEDVGATESYDIHATKGDSVIKVEVKGTTSEGSEIVLTANEVALHLAEHPHNALAVVRRIVLNRSGDQPVATGGELDFRMSWELQREWLKPIAYRYRTDG